MLWRQRTGVLLLSAGLALTAVSGSTAAAGLDPHSRAQDAQVALDRDALRSDILRRYRVVPVRDGIVLIPRAPLRGIESIEITDSAVAIDGQVVTGAELTSRLGSTAAQAVLSLSYLDPASRLALFRPESAESAPPAAAAPRPAPVQPLPAQPAAPAPPVATPSRPEPETDVRPDRPWRSETKVRIGEDLHVREDERVNGPVVAVLGSVTVDGEVWEDVVAVLGDVRLGPKAVVRGDVTAVGGHITRDPGARARGEMHEVAFRLPRTIHVRPIPWDVGGPFWNAPFGGGFSLALSGFRMAFIGILAFLTVVLVRKPIERIGRVVIAEPWKAGLVGLLAQLLFLPVLVLAILILAVSVIGIPLLIVVPPLLIVALLVAWLMGFTSVAAAVGTFATWRFGLGRQGMYYGLIVGLLVIWLLTIIGRLAGLAGWTVWMVASIFLVAGFIVEYIAWTVGLGAALMTRLGSRSIEPPPMPAEVSEL